MFRVCVDVGGTFTDCLVLDDKGHLRQFKAPTTPADPSLGLVSALEKAASGYGLTPRSFLGSIDLLIHGTTLATNTLINGNGARTGMITTKNFRDILEVRRGFKNVRTSMYNVFVPPYRPLIPRRLRREAAERTYYTGEIGTPLSESDVRAAAATLRAEGVESIAVCFLHSYANPTNEARASEIVRNDLPDTYVTTSHEILQVWREMERFSTTAVSAYIGPAVERYLHALVKRLGDGGFNGFLLLVLSSGLLETAEYCIPRAVQLIGSGPAAAPSGALRLGIGAGHDDILNVDMGGTSFDVCMIRHGEIPTTTDGWIQEERVAIKMIDIRSAGAGGGSIAWIDSLGLLQVGPRSAGGDPGPACYGRGGTEPTVTDADLILGYIPADYFLGGEIQLNTERAETAIAKVARPLNMTIPQAAEAIFTTVNSFMADTITEVATRNGHDVRDFTLVGGGGAGPVHAASIAELLHIPTVIIPPVAATYSAFGMFAMDIGRNYARSYVARAKQLDLSRVNALYQEMEDEAVRGFAKMNVPRERVTFTRTAELRYIGQFHEVEVQMLGGTVGAAEIAQTIEAFHRRHEQLYTFAMPWKDVELLTFRLRVTTPPSTFSLREIASGTGDASGAVKRRRACWSRGVRVDTPVYDGSKLRAGDRFDGPAIVEETTTTVVIPATYSCEVDRWQNYKLTRKRAGVAMEAPARLAEVVA